MNSKYKAALLGVPLVVSTVVFSVSIIALGEASMLEGSRGRYLAVAAGAMLALVVGIASLRAIMHLDRPAGLKATVSLRDLHVRETIRILFLLACATIAGLIFLGLFVSDGHGLFGLTMLIAAPFVWFKAVQSLKCRAFFVHPEDRRTFASK